MVSTSTFAAVLTGSGRGAIAVIRVWGADVLERLDSVFRPARGSGLASTSKDRPRFGRIGAGLGDEVVVIRSETTGGSEAEIQCHGGSAATGLVLDALRGAGITLVRPERWHLRQAGTRIEAEALWCLQRASTLRAAAILLDQANGALQKAFDEIGLMDAYVSNGEVDRLLARARIGLRLVSGWRVVLAGRPNVGKSRLLNALLGFDRAIVDPTAGTTRDLVKSKAAFDGWPVELTDTAGVRQAGEGIERMGIERALTAQTGADLVLLVLDRSVPLTDEDRSLSARYPSALVVANKCDLPPAWRSEAMEISAETGTGIEELTQQIATRLVPDPPPSGVAVPFRPWQVRWLQGR